MMYGKKGCSADMISPRKAMAMGMKPAVVKKGAKKGMK